MASSVSHSPVEPCDGAPNAFSNLLAVHWLLKGCLQGEWLCAGMQRRGMNLKSLAPGGNEHASLAQMRSKVMPTQEKFDPVVYLGTVHWVSVRLT